MNAPAPAPGPAGSTTRGGLLRNASVAALAATFGAALIATEATATDKKKNPSPRRPTNLVSVTSIDTNRQAWQILTIPQTGAKIPFKPLFSDPDTGMQTFLIRYDAGFTNIWHTHPCAHGMWVIDGILVTRSSEGRQEFGPGNFVWFAEGGWMEHGAGKESDCTFLFITNKPFGIFYETDPDLPYPID